MPRSTREWAQRECDAAINNIQWADKHLLKIIDVYIEAHPEIAHPLSQLLEMNQMVCNAITEIRGNI